MYYNYHYLCVTKAKNMTTLQNQIETKMTEINLSMMKSYNQSKFAVSELFAMFSVTPDEFWMAYNSINKQNLLNRFDGNK